MLVCIFDLQLCVLEKNIKVKVKSMHIMCDYNNHYNNNDNKLIIDNNEIRNSNVYHKSFSFTKNLFDAPPPPENLIITIFEYKHDSAYPTQPTDLEISKNRRGRGLGVDTVGGGIGVSVWDISRTSWKIITKFAWIYFSGMIKS